MHETLGRGDILRHSQQTIPNRRYMFSVHGSVCIFFFFPPWPLIYATRWRPVFDPTGVMRCTCALDPPKPLHEQINWISSAETRRICKEVKSKANTDVVDWDV